MSRPRSRRAGTRRAPAAGALFVALLAPATVARAGAVVGIGDQAKESLADPRFSELGVSTVRIVLPWDVAATDPVRLDAWVDDMSARGLEPLVALGRSQSDRCPNNPCELPSADAYRAAFAQLHASYPSIRLFTAWNEPNHVSQPTAGNPAAAARFADIVAEQCPGCTVVGGDLLDAPGMLGYLASYRAALHSEPAVWGLHNYYDTSYFRSTGTDAFVAAVPGPVWLTETGGIVTWRSADGRVQMPYDEKRAASSLRYALDLASRHSHRIERVYVYQWRAGPADDFDAALVRADGSPRPALDVLRSALGLGAPKLASPVPGSPSSQPQPAELVAPPGAVISRITLKRPRLTRAGRLLLAVRCAGGPCRGHVALEGSGRIAERLVNGRTAPGTLAPQRREFDLRAGATASLHLRMAASVLRRARGRRVIVKLTVVPDSAMQFVAVRRVFEVRRRAS